MCQSQEADNVSISVIVKQFRIPKTTLWKRVTGRMIGHGHVSGGKGEGKVLVASK